MLVGAALLMGWLSCAMFPFSARLYAPCRMYVRTALLTAEWHNSNTTVHQQQ